MSDTVARLRIWRLNHSRVTGRSRRPHGAAMDSGATGEKHAAAGGGGGDGGLGFGANGCCGHDPAGDDYE